MNPRVLVAFAALCCWPGLGLDFTAKMASAGEAVRLPGWFWNPPGEEGVELAVGYSTPYYHDSSSYNEAFRDAAIRLWRDRNCRVVVQTGSYTEHDRTYHIGERFRLETDTTGFSTFAQSLVRLDSCWTDQIVLVLLGTRRVDLSDRVEFTAPPDHALDKDPDRYYGFGFAPEYYWNSSSWREAELDARRSLAQAAALEIKALRESWVNDRWSTTRRTITKDTDVLLRGISTLQRSWDAELGQYIIVVSVSKSRVGTD